MLSCGSQVQCPYMPSNPREQVPSLGSSPFTLPGSSVRIANSSSSDKITCLAKDEAIYMKVFMEVDMDRDGKITGRLATYFKVGGYQEVSEDRCEVVSPLSCTLLSFITVSFESVLYV